MFTYKEADLDYIYVRVGTQNKTLNEMTDTEFVNWAKERFGVEIKDDASVKNTPWTPAQKVDFLNNLSKKVGSPIVVMIARERRNEWDRVKNNERKYTN